MKHIYPKNVYELLAEQSKLKMRKKFQDIEVAVNERMKQIFDQLSERGKNYSSKNFEYEDECIEHSEEADMSSHFLRIQKNQLIDLKQHLERYLNTLPIFGFNRLTLRIWSCLSIKKQDQNVTLRAFSHLENRKKSTVLMWTVIVITVKQCSKQWDGTTTSVPVKKLVPPLHNRILSEETR